MTIDTATIKKLRALAHHLKPVVWLGQNGYTDAVGEEIELALSSHQLIKLKVAAQDRQARADIAKTICDQHNAAMIQSIGSTLALYRRNLDKSILIE